jgi:hypothetical protein
MYVIIFNVLNIFIKLSVGIVNEKFKLDILKF